MTNSENPIEKDDSSSEKNDSIDFDEFLMQMLIDPELGAKTLHSVVEKYKPLLYGLCAEIHSMLKDLTNNDDWYATNARNYKQYYDAYMNAGFTEDQAFALLMKDLKDYKNAFNASSGNSVKINKS